MSEPEWTDAGDAAQLPQADDDLTALVVADREIAFYRVEGELFATDNICTHGQARLCEGFLIGHEIECPLHQGRFDVRTGIATFEPAEEPLRAYPVKIEGGRVYVALG